jgi:hypothetical protein
MDADGDMDVLSASHYDDKIAWYENDGQKNFTAHAVTTAANGAYFAYAADVDSDGDLDVLSASSVDGKIAWYRNDMAVNQHPPVAKAGGPYTIVEGQVLTLDASASAPTVAGLTLVSFQWDLDHGGLYDDYASTSPVASVPWATLAALHLTSDGSSHILGLRVTDNGVPVGTGTATTTLILQNAAPTAPADPTPSTRGTP